MEILEIANEIDSLVLDKAVRTRFKDYIEQFYKMVEDYGQAQLPYSKKLENAKKQIDKFTPKQLEKYKLPNGRIEIRLVDICPPPEGYIKMNYWDNDFVKVPMGTIYRPKEPVNPLLWFGISGNASLQRKPSENERLMCDYVGLAIIHDYELRYFGTPTDIYIISDEYKGKWFERDRFCQDFWAHYRKHNEKLSRLERAFNRVQAELASGKKTGKAGDTKTKPAIGEKGDIFKVPISELIKQGESHTLEFKEILEYAAQGKGKNKGTLPSLKTIAGFLNSNGGTLLIGVSNLGKIKGIERDLNLMKRGDNDKFEQKIRNYQKNRFKPTPIGKVNILFEEFHEGTICRIDVQASEAIVHLDDRVYVRHGNMTQLLEGRDLTDWIQQRNNSANDI